MNLIIENKLTYVIWKTNQKWKTLCLFDASEYTMANGIRVKNGMFSKHTWAYLYLYFLFFSHIGKWVDSVLVSTCIKYGFNFQTHNSSCIAFIPYEKKKKFCNNIFALYFHLFHFSRLFLVSNVQSQKDHCTYLNRKILNHNWFWFL